MDRRPIRATVRALGRRGRTYATASVMRRRCARTAASVPIVCKRNAGRSMIRNCMPIASRVLAGKGSRPYRAAATVITAKRSQFCVGTGAVMPTSDGNAVPAISHFRNDLDGRLSHRRAGSVRTSPSRGMQLDTAPTRIHPKIIDSYAWRSGDRPVRQGTLNGRNGWT